MDALHKEEINVYLAYEWGLYDENNLPSQDRSFKLESCGKTEHLVVYRFVDDTGEPLLQGLRVKEVKGPSGLALQGALSDYRQLGRKMGL